MATTMQLDLFEDSRDVMLNNAAVKALSTHDLGAAALAIRALRDEFPRHHNLATHEQLFEQLNDFRRDLEPANLKSRHHQLIHGILPFAERLLGSALVIVWARPLWAELARAATPLVYDSDRRDIHSAPFWLAAGNPDQARSAVEKIPSWRRIPVPLAWMTEIEIKHGPSEIWWPLLAELAWLAPEKLSCLLLRAPAGVVHLGKQFLAAFENNGEYHDLAWFPAWLLIHRSELRELLRRAQPAQNDPARAFALLLDLLHLEKTGQQADLIPQRAKLRALAPDVFADYMRSR